MLYWLWYINNSARALIPKDWGELHKPIYQFQWSSTWIILHSFRFSTISICKFRFFKSFSTHVLQFIFGLPRLLFKSLGALTFYFPYRLANTPYLCCNTFEFPPFQIFLNDSLSSFSQYLQLQNHILYLRFEFYPSRYANPSIKALLLVHNHGRRLSLTELVVTNLASQALTGGI